MRMRNEVSEGVAVMTATWGLAGLPAELAVLV